MNAAAKCSRPGREVSFYCRRPQESKVHNELLELYVIFQAKVLHMRDASGWRHVFDKSVQRLLSIQPLQSITKRGRLAVVMCIVRGGRTDLFAPTVLAVLACDWVTDQWEPFKLLQGAVRQAALSGLRSKASSTDVPSRHWSRSRMAAMLEDGVASTIANSWRGLGIKGAAREQVEKTGRELRGLAARCRGARDRSRAREFLSSYLESNRLESFVQALVVWGREQLSASKPTIFDVAFPFLHARQIQVSGGREDRLDSDMLELDDDHLQGGFERFEAMDERGGSGTACSTPPDRYERSAAASVSSTTEHGGSRRSRLYRGCTWDHTAANDGSSNTDNGSRLSPNLPPQGASDAHQAAESQAVFPPSGAEAGQEKGTCDRECAAAFGDVKPERERKRLGVLRVDQKVFVQMGSSRKTKQWRLGAVAAVRGDGTYNILYDNGEVDRLVRRVDIFEASSSGGRAPQGSMDLEDKNCDGGVDVARKGPGDLHSRQKKRRKLAWSEDSPRLSPDTTDTQPVWEERTPSRPVLFQDEPWSTTGVDVGADTPSPMLAGTKDESGNLRKRLERRNKKRKIVVDQDETTSDECDEPLPYPLPVPLPPTEWPPAEINDFATDTCEIEAPRRVNEVEVSKGDDDAYHREALQTPDTSNLGRVEARELENPGNGVGEDEFIDVTANPKYRQGVEGMGPDSSAVLLEVGHSARPDGINARHGTRTRAGGSEGGGEGEEQAQDDEAETDEELVGGKEEEEEEEEREEEKEGKQEEEEEGIDEEFVGMQECEVEGEGDEQAKSTGAAKERNEEEENGEGDLPRTGEDDANPASLIDTRSFQLRYDSRPLPSPASQSLMEEEEKEEEDDTDVEFVGMPEGEGEEDEQANSHRAAKEKNEENENGEWDLPQTGEADTNSASRVDTRPVQLRYDSRPSPSPASQRSMPPLQSAAAAAAAGRTRSPLARNEVAFASDQVDGLCNEDSQQNEEQGNRDFVRYPHEKELDTCQHGGASQPVDDEIRGDHAHVDDSSGRPDRRAGAAHPDDTHRDFETPTHDSMAPLTNQMSYARPRPSSQRVVATERGGGSGATVPSATDADSGHAENSTCPEQDEGETSAQQGLEKPPNKFHDVVGVTVGVVDGVVDTQSPSRPSRFMRVYGSAGIARVRRSVGEWWSQHQPAL